MSLLTKKKFSFTSKATDKDSFAVVSFKGFEAISKPYQFEIVLVSEKTDIDPLQVLQNPALFTIHRDNEQDVIFNGILIQFEETQEFNGYLFFKAVLTPKLQWLSLTHHNQVFLDQKAWEIMEAALKDGGLVSGIDFEFRLKNKYQPFEYICQYDESHLNFIARWAEREGIYYFFEQTEQGEKVVFTDTNISQTDLLLGKDLTYHPQSGLDSLHTKEVVRNFLCKHSLLPQKIFLKDYNYRKPSLAMEGSAEVDLDGRGENYIYGEHFPTPEEGDRLAKIRAEELLCRKSLFFGKSSVPFIVPGFTFDLQEHYQKIYNRKYLITDVNHEGHQTGYLISGMTAVLEHRDEQMFYSNTFTAIYSDAQFRAERTAVKPKISGTINAKIDAATSGQYAELDDQGRYKVILPFDRSGRSSGKASAWCRMMQPYSGADYGMHFPQHKGGEVLLTFIDGDPDRPIIAGAVPNPETKTPVTTGNQTKCVVRTGGGNQIHTEDEDGKQSLKLYSPTENSEIRIGAPDPDDSPGIRIFTEANEDVVVEGERKLTVDKDNKETIKGKETIEITQDRTKTVNGKEKIFVKKKQESYIKGGRVMQVSTGGDTTTIYDGQNHTVHGDRTVTIHGKETRIDEGHEHTINGDRTFTVTGKQTRTIASEEDFWQGPKKDFHGGLKNEIFIGEKNSLTIASDNAIKIASVLDIFLGIKFAVNSSLSTELNSGLRFTTAAVELNEPKTKIKKAVLDLKNATLTIYT
ncbi:MAG: type VI secretion system tip protein VgrG [Candidatus Electrothrix sp. GM3_4]|nr:type VI secretion system tip protein VgrG [Candidatus Electrothrix sp. GM3_4]